MLDAEEYFHLALHASSVGDYHSCLTYLNSALKQQPRNANALYLLAVQHAELGLANRAMGEIQAALAIEPGLSGNARDMARFQLGLLLLFDRKRAAEAKEQMMHVTASGDATLRTYAEAVIAVADNDAGRAIDLLRAALSQPAGIPALAVLMQRLLDRLSQAQAPAGQGSEEPKPQSAYLGAYGRIP
jgi:tetratricopeptide (TPR) repeat protein